MPRKSCRPGICEFRGRGAGRLRHPCRRTYMAVVVLPAGPLGPRWEVETPAMLSHPCPQYK